MYSSIKTKPCKHEGCLLPPKLGYAGYCGWNHLPDELKEKMGSKRKLQIKKQNAAKYASAKLRMSKFNKESELEMWFKARALEVASNQKCWECNSYVPTKYVRAASAHILFKSVFESVSTHPLNFLFLCAANGCHERSHTIAQFQNMKCFSLAIERFYQFEKEIKERHKYLDLFKEAIENYKK